MIASLLVQYSARVRKAATGAREPRGDLPGRAPGDPLLARIAARVRRLRKERGLTARALAELAGVSLRFVALLEAGQANIAILRLAQVARALDVTVTALVTGPPEDGVDGGDPRARLAALVDGRSAAELERCIAAVEMALGEPRRRGIALLGLRGAGKSTLGPQLATALGIAFVELDDRIEGAAGLSLAELFALHGEAYYRRLETQCLQALLTDGRPFVVALGGGVVQNEDAFRLARTHCTTVWLRARPEDHMDRVLAQGDRRPIAGRDDAMAELQAILAAREPQYRAADLTVDTSHHGGRALDALLRTVERAGWSRPG